MKDGEIVFFKKNYFKLHVTLDILIYVPRNHENLNIVLFSNDYYISSTKDIT